MFSAHSESVAMENNLAKFLAGTLEFQNSSIVKVRVGLKKVMSFTSSPLTWDESVIRS